MLTPLGCATFGVLSFHLADRHIVPTPIGPIVYAAMIIDVVAAVATGWLYDHRPRQLLPDPA